jgi:D-beta-D-heptose 7-phosphate kinase/D-beta-D-heptose 1-phosphate adenosyltransferase
MSTLVVVGDTLLDRDVDGDADRISPDAPALVLTQRNAVERAGGAGLAAVLAAADGHRVSLVTALADDAGGARISQLLAAAGVTLYPLRQPGATPEKIRLRADRRVLLRLDRGGLTGPIEGRLGEPALAAIRTADAVLVSDYGNGVTRMPAIREALAEAPAPVIWDPHPRGAPAVPGTRLVTPNQAELARLTSAEIPTTGNRRLAAVSQGAQQLRHRWRTGAVAVTLGADGALLCHAGATPLVVPAPIHSDGDSCGAGDRFAASAALGLAGGALISEAVQRAVTEAAGYVLAGRPLSQATEPPAEEADERVARVRARGGTVVATGGCFDLLHAGHVATLEAARGLGDCLVVCLNSDASVARLKGPGRPVTPQADRARLLTALGCVDAVVVFDEPTPEAVLSWLRPDIWVKGGDYAGDGDLPETEVVRRWGGQTVVVPYLAGRSTTGVIAAARRNGGGG